MENRKIINATPVDYEGTFFKSKLEAKLFKILQDEGLNPQYEPTTYKIWEGFRPVAPFYIRDKKTRLMSLKQFKIKDITYTPDIVFTYNNYTIFVEVKPDNFTNDVYPYKEKLFRKFMEESLKEYNPIFVRVGTIKNLKEFISILKLKYTNEES